jgi:WD40 repeat protein
MVRKINIGGRSAGMRESHSGAAQARIDRRRSSGALRSLLAFSLIVAVYSPTGASGEAPAAAPQLTPIRDLTRPHGTTSATWSSDGTKLAAYTVWPANSISGNLVTIWSASGQVLREIERPEAFFFADDPLVFVGGNKEVVTPPWFNSNSLALLTFDAESGALIHEVNGPRPDGGRQDNCAVALATSPDQSLLAVVFGALRSQPVGLYATKDWHEIATLSTNSSSIPKRVAFSPDGKLLAIAYLEGRVVLHDVVTKQPVQTINAFHQRVIETIAFSPDSSLLAVATSETPHFGPTDVVKDPVRIYRVKDGSRVGAYAGAVSPIFSLAWSPDGRLLAFITGFSNAKLHLWDPVRQPPNEKVVPLAGHATSLAFSPNGTLAVAHGDKITLFRVEP